MKKIFGILAAAIPIGLLLSILTPRVIYFHPNQTVPVYRPPAFGPNPNYPNYPNYPNPNLPNGPGNPPVLRPNRKLESGELSILQSLQSLKFEEGECEDRVFCDLAVSGSKKDSEQLYKILWKVINDGNLENFPKSMAPLIKAVKNKNCKVLDCNK